MHPHYAAAVRALVVLVLGRTKGISDTVKIHFLITQPTLIAECVSFVQCCKAKRRPEPGSLVIGRVP